MPDEQCELNNPQSRPIIEGGVVLVLLTANVIDIFGGSFQGRVRSRDVESGTAARIYAGEFSGPEFSLEAITDRSFDVFGGLFSSPFVGRDDSLFNIYGSNLTFDGSMLFGSLGDGSAISVPVFLFDNAELRLISVIEPKTVALFGFGLAALGLARRSKAG